MYYFAFEVRNADTIACAGAWIQHPSREVALSKAKEMIQRANWQIDKQIQDRVIDASDYDEKAEGLRYYEQALLDDEVLVIWKVGSSPM